MKSGMFLSRGYLNNKKIKTEESNRGILKMDAKKLLAFGLIILGIFGMSGVGSATISFNDGGDNIYFIEEIVTINWDDTGSFTYLWIADESSPDENSTYYIDATSHLLPYQVNYTSQYSLNTSILNGTGSFYVFINNTEIEYASTPNASSYGAIKALPLNNFSISVSPDGNDMNESTYGVLGGDNVTLIITTEGVNTHGQRATASFVVASTESGATVTRTYNDTTHGNITYKITTTSTANNTRNVTVTNGYAEQGQGVYAVREFNIKAYDMLVNSTYVNRTILESLNASGGVANFTTNTGRDLICTITTNGTNDHFNNSLKFINVTFADKSNSTLGIVKINLTTGNDAGYRTLTVSCVNTSFTDSTTYYVHAASENMTIKSTSYNETIKTTFYVDQNVTISGWAENISARINVNITQPNGSVIWINNDSSIATNGDWNVTWNTNDNWSSATNAMPFLPVGTYTIFAWENASLGENYTTTITITDGFDVTLVKGIHNASIVRDNLAYVDDVVNINGTSTRLNGENITANITGGSGTGGYVNDTANATVANGVMNVETGCNGTFSITWNTSTIVAAGNTTGIYTIFVTDGILNETQTITLENNLTVDVPATGPTGSSITLNGTSTRMDGTSINITIKVLGSIPVLQGGSNVSTNVSEGKWGFVWNTYVDGNVDEAALDAGSYTVTVTDNVSTTSGTIVLGTGELTMDVSTTSAYVDELINISGTTNLPQGTNLTINITNNTFCNGSAIYSTTVLVNASQMYSLNWTPNSSAANLKSSTLFATTGSPINVCVEVSNGTATVNTTLELKDDLTLTIGDSVVGGDQVYLTGISSRVNGTPIGISIRTTSYSQIGNTTVTEQNTVYSSGIFRNTTYYATVDGLITGAALPSGLVLTINATDGIVHVVKTVAITDPTIVITTPTEGQEISIGEEVLITGTSNRVNGTNITFTITGPDYSNSSRRTQVNLSGMYNATWITSGLTATGLYYITAEGTTTVERDTVSVTITAATTTTTTTTSTTTTTIPVVINEFQCDPTGDDVGNEWAELYNQGDAAVDLTGWSLEGENLSGTLAAGAWLQVTFSSQTLTNTGDTITLSDNASAEVDSVAYGDAADPVITAPAEGESAGRSPDGSATWAIFTTPTPEAANTVAEVPGDADGDGNVDYDDLLILAVAYNTETGDDLYDSRADFDSDEDVDYDDLLVLAVNYNT